MPPKRKTQLQFNTKTQIPNRVHRTNITSAAPNVCVKSNHGSELENSIPNEMPPLVKIPSSSNQFALWAHFRSTRFCPASLAPWAASFWPFVCVSRQIHRTRLYLPASHRNVDSPTLYLPMWFYIWSSWTSLA